MYIDKAGFWGKGQGAPGPEPPQNGGLRIIRFFSHSNLKHITTKIIIFNTD